MHVYRRFLLRSTHFRRITFVILCAIVAALSQGLHDFIVHPKAISAERRIELAKKWLEKPAQYNIAFGLRHGELVRQIMWEIDGQLVGLKEVKKPWARLSPFLAGGQW